MCVYVMYFFCFYFYIKTTYPVHNMFLRILNFYIRTMVPNRLICKFHRVGMGHVVHKHLLHCCVVPVKLKKQNKTKLLLYNQHYIPYTIQINNNVLNEKVRTVIVGI